MLPPWASSAAIFDIAKSACERTAPLELMRMKMSVTSSIVQSALTLMHPRSLVEMASRSETRALATMGSLPGFFSMYSFTKVHELKPGLKSSAMSGTQAEFFSIAGFVTSNGASPSP